MNDYLTRRLHTLRKREKIKGRKLAADVFESGKSFTLAPLRIVYKAGTVAGIQTGFAVGTRNFKKATERNKIKRLMRESFRLQKSDIVARSEKGGKGIVVFFVYTGKNLPQQLEIHQQIKAALQKLQKLVYETNALHS